MNTVGKSEAWYSAAQVWQSEKEEMEKKIAALEAINARLEAAIRQLDDGVGSDDYDPAWVHITKEALETCHASLSGSPSALEAMLAKARAEGVSLIERNRWCVVPPDQETERWSIFSEFDGEFGPQNEIGSGATLTEALEMAAAERKGKS